MEIENGQSQNKGQPLAIGGTKQSLAMQNPLSHLVTSLPYIDDQINTGNIDKQEEIKYKLEAQNLINEELKRMPKKDYLKNLPAPKTPQLDSSELIQQEMLRIENNQELPPVNMQRYSVPTTPFEQIDEPSKLKQNIDKIKTLYSHNNMRSLNLELMQKYGPDSYKAQIKELEKMKELIEEENRKVKFNTEEVTSNRKFEQVNILDEIKEYNNKINLMKQRNQDLEKHTFELEKEVNALRAKKMKLIQ